MNRASAASEESEYYAVSGVAGVPGCSCSQKYLSWLANECFVAKHTKRRRSSNFVAIPINGSLTVGALANQAVVLDDLMGGNFTNDIYCMSVDIQGDLIGLTAGEGDPSQLGMAHGDYTVTEVAENLNVILLGPANKIQQEQARRLVRKTGVFHGDGLNTQLTMPLQGKDGSANIRTKLGFVIESGKTLQAFFFNNSGATMTTGATFRYSGTLYGRWIR